MFKKEMGSYIRLYFFLSQIFNYGRMEVKKRHIFFKLLLPHLDFRRERNEIDLSQLLTHHSLRTEGKPNLVLKGGGYPVLTPITEIGGGVVREKEPVWLAELIERVNENLASI